MSLLHDLSYITLALVSISSTFITLRRILKGNISAYSFVLPILIVFYVAPIYLDTLTGNKFMGPEYSFTIYDALQDIKTATIYNYYISCVIVIFTFISRRYSKTSSIDYTASTKQFLDTFYKWRVLGYIALISPIVAAILSNDLSFYMEYANRPRTESSSLQILASKLVSIFLPIFTLLFIIQIHKYKSSNNNRFYLIAAAVVLLFIFANIYIHGKRSIVLSFISLFLVISLISNVIRKKTIVYIGLALIVFFYFYLQFYGKNLEDAQGFISVYKGLRIDFSRDYSLKFVIFHEILNNNYVLPYKGASYEFLATFYIPRELWPDKPYPYAVYFTNSAFGNFGGNYLYGWGLTTSFVMEAVSNLGVLGLVFFPVFYILMIHKVEKLKSILLKIFAYLILMLLLVLHPMSSVLLIVLFFSYKLLIRFRIRINVPRAKVK